MDRQHRCLIAAAKVGIAERAAHEGGVRADDSLEVAGLVGLEEVAGLGRPETSLGLQVQDVVGLADETQPITGLEDRVRGDGGEGVAVTFEGGEERSR